MTVEAILFDKDGTLFDFQNTWGGWAHRVIAELGGGDETRAERIAICLSFDRVTGQFDPDSVVIAETVEAVADAILPHLDAHWQPETLIDWLDTVAAEAPQAEAVPLEPYLAGLRARGLRLGVVTNDSERPARAHLEQSCILGLFDFVAGYDSGHGAKPSADPLLAGARALDADPARVVMVGDSRHDLMAGRAAGMVTVGVLTGVAEAQELAPFADVVMPDIGGLPAWLDVRPG